MLKRQPPTGEGKNWTAEVIRLAMATCGAVRGARVAARRARVRRNTASAARAAAKDAATGPYTATNRFNVPEAVHQAQFKAEVQKREAAMKAMAGFVSCELAQAGDDFTFTQTWESKETYEAWMDSPERFRSHFGQGVWQYKPENKWSVPEEFVPLYGSHM